METIYYCCSSRGLKVITPHSDGIENCEIFGFRGKIPSLLNYIVKNNEFTFSVGKDLKSGQHFICERVQGSLFTTLSGKRASIYELIGSFSDGSLWMDNCAADAPCEVTGEETIDEIFLYLHQLAERGLLTVCQYPERINGIPEDDQDLVDRAILQYRMYGECVLKKCELYHPELRDRVKHGIDSDLFKDYGI